MTALDLMTNDEAMRHIQVADPSAYVECATQRIYGTYKGLPILLAGHGDWKRALENLATKQPRRTAFAYYVLEAK